MAKARARTTARKVKDKWKAKQWYTLVAPKSFNEAVLAESPAESPEAIVGRIATTTMQDLTGDFKLMHVKLHFQVERVNGNRAVTQFAGHSFTSDFVRRLVRRNHSKITLIVDATTKDGARIRVKPVMVTEHRSQVGIRHQVSFYSGDSAESREEFPVPAGRLEQHRASLVSEGFDEFQGALEWGRWTEHAWMGQHSQHSTQHKLGQAERLECLDGPKQPRAIRRVARGILPKGIHQDIDVG